MSMFAERLQKSDGGSAPILPDRPVGLARPGDWAQLNTARLVLAYIVVLGHAVQIFLASTQSVPQSIMEVAGTAAWDAVLCFFVISGLVIGRSLIQKSQQSTDWLFIEFFVRRVARIYPPLLISILCTLVLVVVVKSIGLSEYRGFATNPARNSFVYDLQGVWIAVLTFGFRGGLTGIANGPLWSLALEMRLYVILGLAAQALFGRSAPVRVGAAVLGGYAIKLCIVDITIDYVICYAMFIVGVMLNFLPWKGRKFAALPTMDVEFSYSLYILHFPIFLFIFFVGMSGATLPLIDISSISIFAIGVATVLSFAIGRYVERPAFISSISNLLLGVLRSLVGLLRQ
jgi:peptidoglycan/LPS O-acetylase OafA/YrhL